jgi:hypothetical protein
MIRLQITDPYTSEKETMEIITLAASNLATADGLYFQKWSSCI